MTSIKRIDTSEELVRRLTLHYQRIKRVQLHVELREHQTPSEEGKRELYELNGFLQGMKKAMELISTYRDSTQLPIFGVSECPTP